MRFERGVFFSALSVVILACLVCFKFYGDIVLNSGEYLFGASGDGMKNYFSVAYQVIHGEGLWFNGMLYPYGDHLIFADGQPLLAKILQWFIDPDVQNGTQVISIMNLLMVGSLVGTAWCVHRLLVWNFVNSWFAVPFALCIAFLSPQVARFVGHYALAYTFFIPLSWLFISAFNRYKLPWMTAFLASLTMLAFGFIHPYYLFIFVIFLGSVLGWELLLTRFRPVDVEQLLPRLFTLFVPLVVFMIYQSMADVYTDRPSNPAGMYSHLSTFQSIFTPVAEPFRNIFHSYFFRIFIPTSWEGSAYIGMVTTILLFASIIPFIKKTWTKRVKTITHPVLPHSLKQVLVPGFITLLFAMGVFHHLGLFWLAEYISPIKQFRSLGRVAWIFYYVISVWAVYRLYIFYKASKVEHKGKLKYHFIVICVIAAFAWMLDAIVNIKYTKESMLNQNAASYFGETVAENWKEAGVVVDKHQAILPIPMMLIGSEKIGIEKGWISSKHAMIGSFSTGLPMVGGAMSRTSLNVSEKTAQLAADSLIPRPILDEFDDELKLLLLQSNEPMNTEEKRLVDLAEKVYECTDYNLYSVSVRDIKLKYSEIALAADSIKGSDIVNFIIPTNSEVADDKLWGAESYRVQSGSRLLDSTFQSSELLNISYWVKVDPKDELTPNRVYSINRSWKFSGGIGSSPNILENWLLVSDDIQTEEGKHHVFQIDARPGTISRVMLRKADATIVHSEEGGKRFLNNMPIPQLPE